MSMVVETQEGLEPFSAFVSPWTQRFKFYIDATENVKCEEGSNCQSNDACVYKERAQFRCCSGHKFYIQRSNTHTEYLTLCTLYLLRAPLQFGSL